MKFLNDAEYYGYWDAIHEESKESIVEKMTKEEWKLFKEIMDAGIDRFIFAVKY